MTENTELTLKSDAEIALCAAKSMTVLTNNDFVDAGNARKEIKQTMKNINAYWDPKTDQAFQLHKSLVAAKKEMITPLEQADKLIEQKMGEYRREIERQRMEAERERLRLEEEARAAAAEAQRLVDEASQREELDDDDVEILQLAQKDVTLAEALADSAPLAPPPIKMQGISVRKLWRARIVDPAKVPISIAGIVIRPIDQSALNKLAIASSGGFECPGVEFYQEESTQVRL
jgi:vacuolar-type H+-ATPase subunit I/STV1